MSQLRLWSVALLLPWLFACSTPSFEESPASEFGDARLYPVSGTGFTEAYARRDAKLPSYKQILAEDMDLDNVRFGGPMLSGTVASQWQITELRAETLQGAWQSAIELAFRNYEAVEEGEHVLRISAELQRVQRRNASVTATVSVAGVNPNRRDSINIAAEFRLYDLASGDLLAVIRDNQDRHTEEWTRASGQHMVSLFNSWTALLQSRVSGR